MGLYLQGCSFDGKRLNDIKDSDSELIQMPTCYMGWISNKDPDPYNDNIVTVPVYHALDRETMLCTLEMPNNGQASIRILGGTALFLVGSTSG